ncbi:MAG: hypothetical protein LBU32_28280 [Clostridiales bacterium]|nr:hypothetical protein [Clostridiales bacterium]
MQEYCTISFKPGQSFRDAAFMGVKLGARLFQPKERGAFLPAHCPAAFEAGDSFSKPDEIKYKSGRKTMAKTSCLCMKALLWLIAKICFP